MTSALTRLRAEGGFPIALVTYSPLALTVPYQGGWTSTKCPAQVRKALTLADVYEVPCHTERGMATLPTALQRSSKPGFL